MLIAIISDIHEDAENLVKALNHIDKVGAESIVCLGDIVGYTKKYFESDHSRNASVCVEMIQEQSNVCVAGNHDMAAIKRFPENIQEMGLPDCWFDLSEEKQFELCSGGLWTYDDSDHDLEKEHKDFLRNLNEFDLLRDEDRTYIFSHYPCPDLTGFRSRFISFAEELQDHFDFMQNHDSMLSFSGHRHVEGCLFISGESMQEFGFGKYKIENFPCWVDGPCITSGKRESGFMLFDSDRMIIESIPLKKL
ncbi:MAG: metallophosphoesterase family protein [Bacteroidales bacterium]|nr:metallophosphoesterase family protein [Bacteroidales bacterium]MCF8398063.1 metallophosphoesterase family protein [Bacteroidales bacterium]